MWRCCECGEECDGESVDEVSLQAAINAARVMRCNNCIVMIALSIASSIALSIVARSVIKSTPFVFDSSSQRRAQLVALFVM